MAKDKEKKEKKAAKKAAAGEAGDVKEMSVDNSVVVAADTTVAPKSGSSKKRKAEAADDDAANDEKEIDLSTLNPIAKPLAERKMSKKLFKTIKKASKTRGHVKRGVKEVVKGLRKGEKGLVILAGDISPTDILSHLPVLCEESDVPYIFVASKESLGAASSTKRPTSTVMIVPDGGLSSKKRKVEIKEDYSDEYASLTKDIKKQNERLLLGA